MFDLGKEKINGNCPKCNTGFSATLEKVSRNATITCRGCGERIQLKDQGGKTKKALRTIEGFEKTLKKLGGR